MDFIDKCTDEEEYESIKNILLDDFVNNTAQNFKLGSIGAISAYYRHSHGCYFSYF